MNTSNFRFTLDLHSARSQYSIPVMVGDTAVTLLISITDGGVPYIMSDGCLAKLSIKRPDESLLEETCMIKNNAIVEFPFSKNENTCAMEGVHYCDVTLYAPDGARVGSPRFTMVVSEKVVRSDDIVLTDETRTAVEQIITFELDRQEKEKERRTAETLRERAEIERVVAENERQKNSIVTTEKIADEAVTSEKIYPLSIRLNHLSNELQLRAYRAEIAMHTANAVSKRVTNLEQGYFSDHFLTDATTAYKKTVPDNALPYAEIVSVEDEVTAIKSLGGNKVLSEDTIFNPKPTSNMTVTNLGNGRFQFDGYTSWHDSDYNAEIGGYNSYAFLEVPLKAGAYKIGKTTTTGNTDEIGNIGMMWSINGVDTPLENAATILKVTIPEDTTAYLKVWAYGDEGQSGAVYGFDILKCNASFTEQEVIDTLEMPLGIDNFIAVEPMGRLVFENVGANAVASEVTYMLKGE